MILIGEIKDVALHTQGCAVKIKHLPHLEFLLREAPDQEALVQFERMYSWSRARSRVRPIVMATFGLSAVGALELDRLYLMPTTREWLPITGSAGLGVIDRLVSEGRAFRVKL